MLSNHHYFPRRVASTSVTAPISGKRVHHQRRETHGPSSAGASELVVQNDTGSQGSIASETSTYGKGRRKERIGLCNFALSWKKGRKMQTAQMLILPLIPIVLLLSQNLYSLLDTINYQNSVTDVDSQVEMTLTMGRFCTEIQKERLQVSFFVFTNTTYNSSNLSDQFDKTDDALERINYWPPATSIQDSDRIFESKSRFEIRLDDFRKKISPEDSSIAEVLEYYTKINHHMLEYLTKEIKETNSTSVWRFLIAYKNILRSIENVGISVVYGINYFGRGVLSPTNYIKYIRHDTLGLEYLNGSMEFASSNMDYYKTIGERLDHYGQIQLTRLRILHNVKQPPAIEDAIRYYDMMASYIDELRKLQTLLRRRIRTAVEERVDHADTQVMVSIVVVVLVVFLSPIIIFLVHRATTTIQIFATNLIRKAEELKKEKKKSDRLLFQMLPPSVAQELKQKRQVQAQMYDQVTIYFSDIVGFTEIAAECNPLEVVTFLNSIYKLFDARIERYDVYKVETIGDSYMVASGMNHISEVATMALDLLAGSVIFQVPHRPGEKLQIRIGIHTGSVVAGVVALRIHISMEMKLALDAIGGFRVEHRGLIEVKGKGLMDTYWLSAKDGGVGRSVELDTPGFFDSSFPPAYMADLEDE